MPSRKQLTRTARWSGAAYLGIVIFGVFAELFVRSSLVVEGDAYATASNIADESSFFALGIGADLLMIILDVSVAFGLYRLLKPLDARLAMAATAFRLVQASILVANLLNLTAALNLAGQAAAGADTAADSLRALELHALVYDVGLIAFAIACLTIGHVLRRAEAAPKLLAQGMSATGVVYLVGSLGAVFAPSLSAALDPLYAIAIVVEPAFALWLLITGGQQMHSSTANASLNRKPFSAPA